MNTLDEAIGEAQRIVSFKNEKEKKVYEKHTSELSCLVTAALFTNAYQKFLKQADMNAKSGKALGSRIPDGVNFDYKCVSGGNFGQRFGTGAASHTPYMNWWVVSIYSGIRSSLRYRKSYRKNEEVNERLAEAVLPERVL